MTETSCAVPGAVRSGDFSPVRIRPRTHDCLGSCTERNTCRVCAEAINRIAYLLGEIITNAEKRGRR